MIHIVHFSSQPGGIEVLMPHIINSLPKFQFKVFVMRPPLQGKRNVYGYDKMIDVSYGSYSTLKAYGKLFRYAIKHREDNLHVHNVGPYVLLLLRCAGVKKIVYSIRGTKYWKNPWQKGIRRFVWKRGLGKHIKIVANSEYSRDVFMQKVSNKYPVEVVYNPVYNKRFESVQRIESDSGLQIAYVGRLAKGKNLFKWIDVTVAITEKYPNTKFKIYGDGHLKQELIEYVHSLGMEGKIKFMGYTDDVVSAYVKADLMLFLSSYESFGNVVVESILCGTPVLASAIPSMQEIFQNYPQFLLDTAEDMEQEIVSKIENMEQLKKITKEAKEEFTQRFSLQQYVSQMENIYNFFY